ncbi:hypothetical protein FE257_003444 [Aspergillus nanangensis]|uniref:Uncharacterized protein n=1 Tax=Aspergillus nanangensis TaxID=2582783 RepID=A0AAD4CBL2_ASPNN|nr:hypothetical protein FE257_003444 [Aspergillus nanangensis]
MPRPPTKRNRPISKAVPASSKGTARPKPNRDNTENVPGSRTASSRDASDASQLVPGAQRLEIQIPLQSNKQTPMAKSHEQAIESSPMGERGATGSRPPTRSRGYSSTLSIAGRKGDMGSKVPGTPAYENSVLSNFRRRPRQPSILQVMQAEDKSSDLDDNDDDFLGGLSPEDESTPLHLSSGKSLLPSDALDSSPSQHPLPSSASSRKRKRSGEGLQISQSPLAIAGHSQPRSQTPEFDEDVASKTSSSPGVLQRAAESFEGFSQTMAPPMSSPPSSPLHVVVESNLAKQPNAPDETRKEFEKRTNSNENGLSTANLQDKLLPRRHQRQRKRRQVNNFEVPSDASEDNDLSSEGDEDELSYMAPRGASRSRRKGPVKSKPSSGVGRTQANRSKARSVNKNVPGITKADREPGKVTYKRRSREDTGVEKENEPADMSSPLSSPPDTDALETDSDSEAISGTRYTSKELRLQAKKFAEIDEWKMEFEDVPGSPGSTFR